MTPVAAVILLVGCTGAQADDPTTTTQTLVTTTVVAPTSTTTASSTTTTAGLVVGHLVKLDMGTLRPVAGLEPIPMAFNSSHLTSADGSRMVIFEYEGDRLDQVTSVDVDDWVVNGSFDATYHTARVIQDDSLFMYGTTGDVLAMDLHTGRTTQIGEWPPGVWFWDELHVWGDGTLAGLATHGGERADAYSLVMLDPVSGEASEMPIGPIQRMVEGTGVFDGDFEVEEWDTPGVAWGDGVVYIVHADDLEVTVVTRDTVETHSVGAISWWDRLLASWVPTASAKGPSLGTYSSASLSADGRYLFVSGNRYTVTTEGEGPLVEEVEPLGLTVIDTQTWSLVDRLELPIQFVRDGGEFALAVHSMITAPWVDDWYVADIDSGVLSVAGPVSVQGGCQLESGGKLICSDRSGVVQRLTAVDLQTLERTVGMEIGPEDYVEPNGVLVDWDPDPSAGG